MIATSNIDLSEERLDYLINLAYKSVIDSKEWQNFFDLVCESVSAKCVLILSLNKRSGKISVTCYNSISPTELDKDLINEYKCSFFYSRLNENNLKLRAWDKDDLSLNDDFIDDHPVYEAFLKPYDLRYTSSCKIIENENFEVIFSVISTSLQGPLPPECTSFLNQLIPYLIHIRDVCSKSFVFSTQATVAYGLCDKMRQPLILASLTGEVNYVNPAADMLFSNTDLVEVSQGYLKFPSHINQSFFELCANLEFASDKQSFKQILIQKPNRTDKLYVFYNLVQPQTVISAIGVNPILIVLFYLPKSAPKVDENFLNNTFHLTKSECKIASLLASGLNQNEIALKLGIKSDTVRKQLQVIYKKTDTHQQTDLVRLMLNLPSNFVV